MIAIVLASAVLAATPGSAKGSKAPGSNNEIPEVAPGTTLEQASKIGRALYEMDEAAARATDAVIASTHGRPDSRVRGYLTLPSGGGFLTEFYTADRNVVFEVRDAGKAPSAKAVDPPRPLDGEASQRLEAQKTAAAVLTERCGDSFNILTLPASLLGKCGWLVYLLAATRSRDYLLAGHHRVLVSADGTRILEHAPLAKSCVIFPRPDPAEGELAG